MRAIGAADALKIAKKESRPSNGSANAFHRDTCRWHPKRRCHEKWIMAVRSETTDHLEDQLGCIYLRRKKDVA